MPKVDLSDITSSRLQKIAVPLEDTYDSVIGRLLDLYESTHSTVPRLLAPGQPIRVLEDGTMEFSPANPPSLRFTTVHQAVVDNNQLPRGDTYWNSMMNLAIRLARSSGMDAEAIVAMLFVNAIVGRKDEDGYKYMPDLGISVQGQDSNAAFRQFYSICSLINIHFTVFFSWQMNEKAAFPGQRGYFEL